MQRGLLYLAAAVALVAVSGIALHAWSRDDPDPPPPPDIVCHAGAYRDANGRLLTLTPSDNGLRYRLESGESGASCDSPAGAWRQDATSNRRPEYLVSRSMSRSPKMVAGVQNPPGVADFGISSARHAPAWPSILPVEP